MSGRTADLRIQTTHVSYPHDGAIAAAVVNFVSRAIGRWREHRAEARAQREAEALLLGMSDRDLRDIGLTRDQLHRLYHDGQI